MINTIEQYKEQKNRDNLLLAYKGIITESLTTNLLSLAENKLAMVEYNSRLKKKVFHILVEVLQNIYHNYSELKKAPEEFHDIMVMIIKTDNSYDIVAGNYLPQNQTESLKSRIDSVNAMDAESLRTTYRNKLDEGVFSDSGRAGLGIMDMVRKSGQALEYDFLSIDKDFSFFSIKVKIKN